MRPGRATGSHREALEQRAFRRTLFCPSTREKGAEHGKRPEKPAFSLLLLLRVPYSAGSTGAGAPLSMPPDASGVMLCVVESSVAGGVAAGALVSGVAGVIG